MIGDYIVLESKETLQNAGALHAHKRADCCVDVCRAALAAIEAVAVVCKGEERLQNCLTLLLFQFFRLSSRR